MVPKRTNNDRSFDHRNNDLSVLTRESQKKKAKNMKLMAQQRSLVNQSAETLGITTSALLLNSKQMKDSLGNETDHMKDSAVTYNPHDHLDVSALSVSMLNMSMAGTSITRFKDEKAVNKVGNATRMPTKLTSKTISSNPYWSQGPRFQKLIKEVAKRSTAQRMSKNESIMKEENDNNAKDKSLSVMDYENQVQVTIKKNYKIQDRNLNLRKTPLVNGGRQSIENVLKGQTSA